MTEALHSNILLQALTIALAALYAAFVTLKTKNERALRFSTSLLQAMTFEAAIVALASLFYPPLFNSVVNQRGFISVIAMMTLVYSTRDIISTFDRFGSSKHRADPQDRV